MINDQLQKYYETDNVNKVIDFLVENQIEVNTLLELYCQITKYFGRCRPTLFIDHSIKEIVIYVPIKDMSAEEIFEKINKFDKQYLLNLPTKIFSKICVAPKFC